jgi:hypothetical protein
MTLNANAPHVTASSTENAAMLITRVFRRLNWNCELDSGKTSPTKICFEADYDSRLTPWKFPICFTLKAGQVLVSVQRVPAVTWTPGSNRYEMPTSEQLKFTNLPLAEAAQQFKQFFAKQLSVGRKTLRDTDDPYQYDYISYYLSALQSFSIGLSRLAKKTEGR